MTSDRPVAAPFTARDWLLVICTVLMWGSSFIFIKLGLEDFAPASITWLRIALGAVTLALIPAARTPLRDRRDWGGVVALGIVWMAAPFLLFALAQQHIPSALAGMINGSAPLFTAVVALLWFHDVPDARLMLGLLIGFGGVVAIGLPNVDGAASLWAVVMVLGAAACYGIAFNITGPLQRRNGALPVIWRAQLVGGAIVTPFGVPQLVTATPSVTGALAMLALGALGTGIAYVFFTDVIGRVGASRASVTTYLLPVVALVIGVVFAGESIAPLSLVGIALVLLGAYIATSARRPPRPARPAEA